MVSCNLPPALLAEWLGSFTCYCGNTGGTDAKIRVSTESWPWRSKFSCHSCQDSNPWPFDHESGTATTELSWLPRAIRVRQVLQSFGCLVSQPPISLPDQLLTNYAVDIDLMQLQGIIYTAYTLSFLGTGGQGFVLLTKCKTPQKYE